MKNRVEEIIGEILSIRKTINQQKYSIKELEQLIKKAYDGGVSDGYNEGYKDGDECAKHDQEYLK
jgi:hypothetical protein